MFRSVQIYNFFWGSGLRRFVVVFIVFVFKNLCFESFVPLVGVRKRSLPLWGEIPWIVPWRRISWNFSRRGITWAFPWRETIRGSWREEG